jgi:hypothetical protein
VGNTNNYQVFGHIAYARNITGTPQTLWDEGTIYTFPGSAQQMFLSSMDANDNASGNGARLILVNYLDNSYYTHQEVVPLNGTTPVGTTATNILRVNGLNVISSGNSMTNLGKIYMGTGTFSSNGVPENKYSTINSTDANSQVGAYTIPADRQGTSMGSNVYIEGNKEVLIEVQAQFHGTNTQGTFSRFPVVGNSFFSSEAFTQALTGADANIVVSAAQATADSVYFTTQWYWKYI